MCLAPVAVTVEGGMAAGGPRSARGLGDLQPARRAARWQAYTAGVLSAAAAIAPTLPRPLLHWFGRRKWLLLTHAATLFSVFEAGAQAVDLRATRRLVTKRVERELRPALPAVGPRPFAPVSLA